ncbi:MAG TPA: ribosome maturation factor RimP [Kofleriaceae bacterium]|jgi:ribosome maturation factor RimP|nr:ribosome maturation factor RimP [Kofleriaceae bacterium]
MSRNPLQQRLISIVEPVCQAAGYELVDLRFLLEQGGWTLRVAIDRPLDEQVDPGEVPADRVDLIDCENLSRELSAVLDVEDPIPQAFHLEVGSPGIDRPLRTAAHFQRFAGSEAKIQLAVALHLPAGDRRNFKGILQGFDDGHVLIDCEGTAFRLPIDDIDHARLVPDWDAVMRGRSGVGKPPAVPGTGGPVKPGHRPSQKRKPEGRGGRDREAQAGPAAPAPAPVTLGRVSDVRNKEQG